MKAWELMYKKEVLNEAINHIDDVKIIHNDDFEIKGQIDNFEVSTCIEYDSPSFVSCTCSQQTPCIHEASFIYYLEKHPELFRTHVDFEKLLEMVNPEDLKKFLLHELSINDELKGKFLNEFQRSPINKTYYKNKLSKIFKQGEGRDFEYHGFYELDLMKSSLQEFLDVDINTVLVAGEYDFACDLLLEIGDLLNDELISCQDAWYDLADAFMFYVHRLSNSIHIDSDRMKKLSSKTNVITDIIPIF